MPLVIDPAGRCFHTHRPTGTGVNAPSASLSHCVTPRRASRPAIEAFATRVLTCSSLTAAIHRANARAVQHYGHQTENRRSQKSRTRSTSLSSKKEQHRPRQKVRLERCDEPDQDARHDRSAPDHEPGRCGEQGQQGIDLTKSEGFPKAGQPKWPHELKRTAIQRVCAQKETDHARIGGQTGHKPTQPGRGWI